ncbi:MAG: restriction endonuclease [Thermoflexibacter sp.]|nr:restriction endonuclease [Thermoflexibacter sp.]
MVECKNEQEKVDKNQFIQFFEKLKNTGGMSNLGILITSQSMKDTAYKEAIRKSSEEKKVVFISNVEIGRLIKARNILEEFKVIIDEQVKDN